MKNFTHSFNLFAFVFSAFISTAAFSGTTLDGGGTPNMCRAASDPNRSGLDDPAYSCFAKKLDQCEGASAIYFWSFACSGCGSKVLASITRNVKCSVYKKSDPAGGGYFFCSTDPLSATDAPSQAEMNKACAARALSN